MSHAVYFVDLILLIYLFSRSKWWEGWKILKHSFNVHLSAFVLNSNQIQTHSRWRAWSPGEVLYVNQHGILLHVELVSDQQQLHQLLIQTWTEQRDRDAGVRLRPHRRRRAFFRFWCVFVLRPAFQGFFLQLFPTTQRSDCGRR